MNHNHWLDAEPWRVLQQSIPSVLELLREDPRGHGLNTLVGEVWQYLGQTAACVDRGAPVVWYNLGFTPELILGLGGAGHLCIASLGALQAILGDPEITHQLIDHAESSGVPAETCSADKASIGAIKQGLYPRPACCIGINTPCDTQVLSTQAMAELSGRPTFIIDVPYYNDERTLEHVASQLLEMVPFLEQHTGLRMDWGRMREVCELSNQAIEQLLDWMDERRRVPLTQSGKLVAFTFIHQLLFAGTPAGVRIAEALAREARERNERGERPYQERVRAVWYQDPVWTDLQIYDWMENELGLSIPVDVFGYYASEGLIDTATPESMAYGLARKLSRSHPMARQFRGNIENYIGDFLQMHESFQADCGIFAGHVACKHAWGGLGLFREACRNAGIPLLVFEFDMFDSRITPREAIEAELTRFVNEVVWPRKQRNLRRAAR